MKVVVTGAGGMLARALVPELTRQGMDVVPLHRQELDVTRPDDVRSIICRTGPDVVIHCAGYTQVDAAETDRAGAFALNAEAVRLLADACQTSDALLVYPSTDYVFPGTSSTPYTPDAPVGPLNVYGSSKVAGEREARSLDRHLIVRTSWLYGAGGRNFVDTISKIAAERKRLEVVQDQVGLPTWTGSLSYIIGRLLKVGAVGTFHAADAGEPLCWSEFAKEILRLQGIEAEVVPITSEAYGAPARRPKFSILDCTRTEQMLGEPLPVRDVSLVEYLARA